MTGAAASNILLDDSSFASSSSLLSMKTANAPEDEAAFQTYLTIDAHSKNSLLDALKTGHNLQDTIPGNWPKGYAFSIAFKNPGVCSVVAAITGGNSHITSFFTHLLAGAFLTPKE